MNAATIPAVPAITLKTASFDDVAVFVAAARKISRAQETAKSTGGEIVGALFRLSAGMTPADAGARVQALYDKVYADVPKANAGGASSYRAIIGVFKNMAAAGLTIALPVYETVNAAKAAYEAHANGLPANVEAKAKAEAEAFQEAEELRLAAVAVDTANQQLLILSQAVRVFLGMEEAELSEVIDAMNAQAAPMRAKAEAARLASAKAEAAKVAKAKAEAAKVAATA